MKKWINIFTPLAGGIIVSIFTNKYMDLDYLTKPFLTPPKIMFPIIWSLLYLLIGISWYLIIKYEFNNKKTTIIYYLSLFINYFWSFLFFNLKLRLFSFFWILLLDALVIILLINYFKKYKISFYLNIPYLIWLILATYLNLGLYLLN